jgi:hypothetical protein
MEKQLEVLKKALEMGANIDIRFHNNTSKEDAETKIKVLSELLDLQYTERGKDKNKWFITDYLRSSDIIVTSYFDEEETK